MGIATNQPANNGGFLSGINLLVPKDNVSSNSKDRRRGSHQNPINQILQHNLKMGVELANQNMFSGVAGLGDLEVSQNVKPKKYTPLNQISSGVQDDVLLNTVNL